MESAKSATLGWGFAFGLVVLFTPIFVAIMSVIPQQPAHPPLGEIRPMASAVLALMLISAAVGLLISLVRLHRVRANTPTEA